MSKSPQSGENSPTSAPEHEDGDSRGELMLKALRGIAEGLPKLSIFEVSAFYKRLRGDIPAMTQRESESDRDFGLRILHAIPYLAAKLAATELIGRLFDDPISWQHVETLIVALPDADRDALFRSIEKRHGWAVRKTTLERQVREAKKRGPKKSDDRLELLALAWVMREHGKSWAEILTSINEVACDTGLKSDGEPVGSDNQLYDKVVNLKTAVQKEKKNRRFQKYVQRFQRAIAEPEPDSGPSSELPG